MCLQLGNAHFMVYVNNLFFDNQFKGCMVEQKEEATNTQDNWQYKMF